MHDNELSELLRGATAGLEPSPDFAQQVLVGARRRRLRRRVGMALSAVVVVAVVVGATAVAFRTGPVTVADQRLTTPTKGDLAGDQAFLDKATKAWRGGLSLAPEAASGVYDDRLGDPHVYWAGRTPAGNAAIVLQEVDVHDDAQVPADQTGPRTAEGLVAIDPKDGRLKLVSTRVTSIDVLGNPYYYKFGPDDRTMLVVDEGKPLHYTYEFAHGNFDPENKRVEWHRVKARNGVALVRIPEKANEKGTVAYQGNRPPAVVDWAKVPRDFYINRMPSADGFLAKRLPSPTFRTSFLPWREVWLVGKPAQLSPAEQDSMRGLDDNWLAGGSEYVSLWAIIARLDDGRTIILQEVQSRTALPKLTVTVRNPPDNATTMDPVGAVDGNAVLPVKFHVPDAGGWIVAQRGKALSYRTAPGGAWQEAGKDAALLPENAVEVKVGDTVVPL